MTDCDRSNFDPSELTRLRKSIDRAFTAGRLSAEEHERQLVKIEQRQREQEVKHIDGFPLRARLFVAVCMGVFALPFLGFLLLWTSHLWRHESPEKYWKRQVISLEASVKDGPYWVKRLRLDRLKELFDGEIEVARYVTEMKATGADSNSIKNSVADLRAANKVVLEMLDDQIKATEQELSQTRQELEYARSQLSKYSRDGNSPP